MATKIIKALIDGVVQEIEVEVMTSPEQPLSYDERLDTLEDKHDVVFTDGNLLVGNGTTELEEMTPEEVLSHINGASVTTMTTAEYEALSDDDSNANTLYVLTDSDTQPDWLETDPESESFIKNKPSNVSAFTNDAGYLSSIPLELIETGGILLSETTNDFAANTECYVDYFELVEGETYIVVWDGTEHECVCQHLAEYDFYILGNGSIVGLEDTGEPFAIGMLPSMNAGQVVSLDQETHTFMVYSLSVGYVKIAEKHIPNSVPHIEDKGIVTVLQETTYTGLSSSTITEVEYIPLVGGTTYTVNWNGTEYTYTALAVSESNAVILGNQMPLIFSDTGEPFSIISMIEDSQPMSAILPMDGSTEATISIKGKKEVLYKIDEKLLPDDVNTTYTLVKEGSNIKLVGSDGSETSVTDDIGTLSKLGVAVSSSAINGMPNRISSLETTVTALEPQVEISAGQKVEDKEYTIDGITAVAGYGAEVFNSYSGTYQNIATGDYSHAEGYKTTATGDYSHAEGNRTVASGVESHAEGYETVASDQCSHAEGSGTVASGYWSHAEGYETVASGRISHSEGRGTIASAECQHVQGRWNTEDSEGRYLHIVGIGSSPDFRFNAHTVDWSGNAWYKGDVYIGGMNQDEGKKLATEDYIQQYVEEQLLGGAW